MEGTTSSDEAHAAFAWFALEPVFPGSALFALLVSLSLRFVRHGFEGVRQHGLAPANPALVRTTRETRRWWPCACEAGACACVAAWATMLGRIDRACERTARRCAAVLRGPAQRLPAGIGLRRA
jgi:hypothetical protein